MKYSIIVPVYKAEKTIRRCVESLIAQECEDAEILLINDGSPDQSGEICKDYEGKYPNIKYFEKENGGVSSARNVGLKEAIGRYVLFVDSDDYVDKDYLKSIDIVMDKYSPDLLLFSLYSVGNSCEIWSTGNYYVDTPEIVAEKTSEAMHAYLFSTLMSKVFVRDIICRHDMKFEESLSIGEDQVFIFQYAMYIKNMCSIEKALYFLITENKESLSRKKRSYLSQQLLTVNYKMLEALNNSIHTVQVKNIYKEALTWVHFRSAYSSCKELLKFKMSFKNRRNEILKICKSYTCNEFKPTNWKCGMIALPVMLNLSTIIDIIINIKHKEY